MGKYLFLCIDPFFRLNEEHFTCRLQYKHSGTFAYRKYEELFYSKRSENVRPHSLTSNSIENATPCIIVNPVVKMRPHRSQSSRENATPSSGTSPVASYKEVPPRVNNSLVARKQISPLLLFCIRNQVIIHLKSRWPPVREYA